MLCKHCLEEVIAFPLSYDKWDHRFDLFLCFNCGHRNMRKDLLKATRLRRFRRWLKNFGRTD